MQTAEKPFRKQILIYQKQIEKLNQLSRRLGKSEADLIRRAIDAYDPEAQLDIGESELLDVALLKVNEALADMRETSVKLNEMLDSNEPSLPIEATEEELESLKSFLQGSKGPDK